MPQSLSQVILHVVLITKDRRPWLVPAILATLCREVTAQPTGFGGGADAERRAGGRLARRRMNRAFSANGILG